MQNAIRMQSYTLLKMVFQNNNKWQFFHRLVFLIMPSCLDSDLFRYDKNKQIDVWKQCYYTYDLKRADKLVSQWNEFKWIRCIFAENNSASNTTLKETTLPWKFRQVHEYILIHEIAKIATLTPVINTKQEREASSNFHEKWIIKTTAHGLINGGACGVSDCKYLFQMTAVKFEEKNRQKKAGIYLGNKSYSSTATNTEANDQKTATEQVHPIKKQIKTDFWCFQENRKGMLA